MNNFEKDVLACIAPRGNPPFLTKTYDIAKDILDCPIYTLPAELTKLRNDEWRFDGGKKKCLVKVRKAVGYLSKKMKDETGLDCIQTYLKSGEGSRPSRACKVSLTKAGYEKVKEILNV